MEIKERPNNDLFAQYIRACKIRSKNEEKRRIAEMKNCHHEFVVLKEGTMIGGHHASDYEYIPSTVECVHCQLTNKYMDLEQLDKTHPELSLNYLGFLMTETLESKVFRELFTKTSGYNGRFDERQLNKISKQPLRTEHPNVLYQLAKQMNAEATNKQLFQIMTELASLETRTETLKIATVSDATALYDRYQTIHKNNGKGSSYTKQRKLSTK